MQKIGRGRNEGGEGKEEKEEEEEEEKEEDEEEDEEDEEEDKEDEEDEEEEEDEAKRRGEGRGGGGESVENLVRGDSFKAKAEAKPKQSKIHKTRRQAGGFYTMKLQQDHHAFLVDHAHHWFFGPLVRLAPYAAP